MYPFGFPTSPARRSLSIFAMEKRNEKKNKKKNKKIKIKERKETLIASDGCCCAGLQLIPVGCPDFDFCLFFFNFFFFLL